MSRLLFLRSYLAIIILIVGVGWGLDKLLLHLAAEENLQSDRRGINTAFLYLESVLKQQETGVEESWDKHRTKIQVALGYPIALYRINDFSGERKVIQTLKAGEIMTVATEQKSLIYYRKSQNSDYILL